MDAEQTVSSQRSAEIVREKKSGFDALYAENQYWHRVTYRNFSKDSAVPHYCLPRLGLDLPYTRIDLQHHDIRQDGK